MKIKKIENLWVAANKLRGAFEITELHKVMLYGLLFKYLELKKEKFSSYDEHLIFEALNEPRVKGSNYEWWYNSSAMGLPPLFKCFFV